MATFPPCQCGRKNEAARYGDRRTAKEALMVVSEQVHDVDYYVHVLRRDISFLRTLSLTLSFSISFYFSVGSLPPQCKQHEVRDGCDKSAEVPDAEGLRKAADDATGAFAAATTQRGSGREPKKMSRTRAEAAEQGVARRPQARTAAPRKPCERTRRKARQLTLSLLQRNWP